MKLFSGLFKIGLAISGEAHHNYDGVLTCDTQTMTVLTCEGKLSSIMIVR